MAFACAQKINYKLGLLAIALGLIIHHFLPANDLADFFMGAFLSFGSVVVLMNCRRKSAAPQNPA